MLPNAGNPRGRPKGKKKRLPYLNEERLQEIIIAEAYRTIELREGDRILTYPIAQAVIRSHAIKAVQGHARSQELFTELLAATERSNKQLYDDYRDVMFDYKLGWEKELEDRKRTGRTGPEPIPHPDHISFDMITGLVHVKGPWTKEDKAHLEKFYARKQEFEDEAEKLRALLDAENDPIARKSIQKNLDAIERLIRLTNNRPDLLP